MLNSIKLSCGGQVLLLEESDVPRCKDGNQIHKFSGLMIGTTS